MKILIKILILLVILASSGAAIPTAAWAQLQDPFQQWSIDLTTRKIRPGDSIPLEVGFLIPPNHYLYREKMGLSLVDAPKGFKLGNLELSPSLHKKDPFTGNDEEIYEGVAVLRAKLEVDTQASVGARNIKLLLTYQGCSDKLCYRFMRREIELPVVIGTTMAELQGHDDIQVPDAFEHFRDRSFFIILLLTFLGGVASAFTPCVLPVIPITLAFIGVRKKDAHLGRNFFLSAILVLSMSLTYAILGLLAALLGKSLGFLFQSPYFLIFGILLYIVFSLSLFGLFEMQMPFGLRNRLAKLGGAGVIGAILSGFTIGFLAAPCVGPLIASLLLYVAKSQNIAKGFILLFVYGLGMGTLFLLIGTFYDRLAAKIRGGRYTVWIERTFAVILLIPAFYYGSVLYTHFRHQAVEHHTSAFWIQDVEEGFEKAAKEGKPMFVDFFASWCFPCVEMEKRTFSDEGLRKFLTKRFIPIKVDCTEETPQCQRMVEKYSVVGWPTFLILTPEGVLKESFIGKSLSAEELQKALESPIN